MMIDRSPIDRSPIDREHGISPVAMYYFARTFIFTGTVAGSTELIINGWDYTVLNNDVNAIGDFSGDFPEIPPGGSAVRYSDNRTTGTVRITVKKKDRSV